jgi:Neuraminidase (sialidase)
MCRLKNGDIVAVFYAGYGHVSLPKPPEWPKGGRICLVRSKDEGKTWTLPQTIFDDAADNRDPHIAEMPDGRLALTFFSLIPNDSVPRKFEGKGIKLAYSRDGGKTWDKEARTLVDPAEKWYCSAPVRVLPSGTWLLGVYKYNPPGEVYGGVLRSTDQGKTWSAPIPIGKEAGVPLDAETDVITLKDGSIFAALRCGQAGMGMRYATSKDDGKSWSPVLDAGFHGEAPYLYRLKNGTLLLGVRRRPDTVLYVSRNETLTWKGPYQIDSVLGAYPSIVERKDGTVLIVYYTEGKDSEIRVRRFQIDNNGITALPL